MANSKIENLTELAVAPATTDVLPIVDDPAGSPVTKKITVANLTSDVDPRGIHDMPVSSSAMWASTTLPAGGLTQVETTSNKQDFMVWEFDTTLVESVQFTTPIPREYDNGTVTATFYWTNAAGLTTETVDWGIKAVAMGDNDTWDVAWGTEITTTDTWIAQGDIHTVTSAAITVGGTPVDADFIQWQITRKTSTDNLTGDARLIGIVLHITTDASVSA
tara:strand:+ start:1972 stop:2628 length:657 start_codon:yes stop_codon:yes gene_type:complete